MNAMLIAAIGQIESSDYIASNGGFFIVLAPIHVRAPGDTGAIENMSWFDSRELSSDSLAIFHAYGGGADSVAKLMQ